MNQVVKSNEVMKSRVFGLISGAQGPAPCHRKFAKPDLVSDWLLLTEGWAFELQVPRSSVHSFIALVSPQ